MATEALKTLGIEKYLDPSKDILKTSLLYRVEDISNKQSQEKNWIKERRPHEHPFQDLMDDFFNKCKVNDILAHVKEYEITEDQFQYLSQLSDALKNY